MFNEVKRTRINNITFTLTQTKYVNCQAVNAIFRTKCVIAFRRNLQNELVFIYILLLLLCMFAQIVKCQRMFENRKKVCSYIDIAYEDYK